MPRSRSSFEERKLLGEELRQERKAARLSQAEVGERFGVSAQQIGKYERGESEVSIRLLELARSGFGKSPAKAVGFGEEAAEFKHSEENNQYMKVRWRELRSHIEHFVKGMNDLTGT